MRRRNHVLFRIVFAAVLLGVSTAASAVRAEKGKRHVVVRGDNLGRIAKHYRCSVDELRRANELDGDTIVVGRELVIPSCSANEGGRRTVDHMVAPRETLSGIAERYGCSVEEIKRLNRLRGDTIVVGKTLKVRTRLPVRERRKFIYTIKAGDTLSGIARRYGMDWKEIQRLNPRKDPRKLKIGDRLKLYRDGPEQLSHTVGRPQAGRLVNGEQLPAGPGYYRRRPHRAWGTNETITNLLAVIAAVKDKHPNVHDAAIGDISAKRGGKLPPHISHQSGRDVDLGYYFLGQPKKGPQAFIRADRNPLDYEANWTLLTELTGKNERSSRVEYIFISYRIQKLLYDWAVKAGKPRKLLRHMFQYPRGQRALEGLIRHEPGHEGHLHIRFKCPARDTNCLG